MVADPTGIRPPRGLHDITPIDPDDQTRVEVTPPAVAIACSATEQGLPVAGPTTTVG